MPPPAPKTNGVLAGSDKKAGKPSRAQLKREKKKAKKAAGGGNESATGGETETESEMESEAEVSTLIYLGGLVEAEAGV